MSLLAMPLLIVNMGGEMLYILEQRLQAQSIPTEKSRKVLQDVISTMFSSKFIEELFKPQEIYTNQSTRQIFDRLAHSSIMRLNESSMDKLYDLMTMGFKYQTLSCSNVSDLMQVTLNHLDALAVIVHNSDVTPLIEFARKNTVERYGGLTLGQFNLVRQTLCRFLQDRKVKVSLFLQDAIQNADGSIVITHTGTLPKETQPTGTINYYKDNKFVSEVKIDLANSDATIRELEEFDISQPHKRPCKLGTNLYSKNRKKGGNKSIETSGPKLDKDKTSASAAEKHDKTDPPSKLLENVKTNTKAAKAELNLLAQLVGIEKKPVEKDNFKINLFPDTQLQPGAEVVSGAKSSKSGQQLSFSAKGKEESLKQLQDSLVDFTVGDDPEPEHKDNEADLLDLMDEANTN